MTGSFITSLLIIALPLGAMSFAIYYYLLTKNHIKGDGSLRDMRDAARKSTRDRRKDKSHNVFERKWFRFGTGYYGIMALLTFVIYEYQDTVTYWSQPNAFQNFIDAFGIGPIINFFVNQIMNFVSAFLWPGYWIRSMQGMQIIIWFAVTYGCYLGGVSGAKYLHTRKTEHN